MQKMKVTAILNRRGGVGKTTTAHNLGAGLIKRGYKVLYIDLDSQENLTVLLNGNYEYPSIKEVLAGADINKAIQTTRQGDLIRASDQLSDILKLPKYALKMAVESIKHKYDYVIIDTSPSLSTLTLNALNCCNDVVITCQAEILSIKGLVNLYNFIETIQNSSNKKLKINGILLTRFNNRTILSQQLKANFKNIADQLNTRLYDTVIRECNAIKESQAMQQNIYDYAKNSNAAIDYNNFTNEYLERE